MSELSQRAPQGARIKTSFVFAWAAVGVVAILLALMWATHTAPVARPHKTALAAGSRALAAEPAAERTPAPAQAAPPAASAGAPPAVPETPIRDDLTIYYLADVQGEIKPCG